MGQNISVLCGGMRDENMNSNIMNDTNENDASKNTNKEDENISKKNNDTDSDESDSDEDKNKVGMKHSLGPLNIRKKLPQIEELRLHFERFDADGNGYITANELGLLIKGIYEPTKEELDHFIKQFDRNSDGTLTWVEFYRGVQRLNKSYRQPGMEQHIRALFRKYDQDGSEYIQGREIVQVSRDLFKVNPNMLRKVLLLFDEDNDGKISFEEFVHTIERLNGDLSLIWQFHREAQRVKVRNRYATKARYMKKKR